MNTPGRRLTKPSCPQTLEPSLPEKKCVHPQRAHQIWHKIFPFGFSKRHQRYSWYANQFICKHTGKYGYLHQVFTCIRVSLDACTSLVRSLRDFEKGMSCWFVWLGRDTASTNRIRRQIRSRIGQCTTQTPDTATSFHSVRNSMYTTNTSCKGSASSWY